MTYPKVAAHRDEPGRASRSTNGAPPSLAAKPAFPALEEAILDYWATDGTFQASIDARPTGEKGGNEFVFYDGPPFANGLPHYGHLLTGYVKDVVPRYQTMRGRRVERRFGWDTHGLPAELEAMKQNGIKTTDEIRELGIAAFNDACRASVLQYTDDWREYVTRQARWVDFDDDYKTLNPDYMESVMWAFKQLYTKGLAYEGFRILPYCWNDETPLSNHELRMDDEIYQSRQDPAITVGYRLETGELLLIWTTTPWTLPSNMGVAVHPDIEYVVVQSDVTGSMERYVLARARAGAYARELAGGDVEELDRRIVGQLTGRELAGRRYTPPFDYYAGSQGAHRVFLADFVTVQDGTGAVHMSPGFGEDDKATLDAVGVETVVPVGVDGRFTHPVSDYAGIQVFDANPLVIDHLKARTRYDVDGAGSVGLADDADEQAKTQVLGSTSPGTVLLRRETYDHPYPHCWRCREPLIYMAVSSWFVATTKIRDRMLACNQEITWVPEHTKDGQFGKWLENTRDWSISRNRFWGSPIPVWKSDDPAYPRMDVYGSVAELEADFGVRVTDLHRPMIDELTRANPDDPRPLGQRSTMRRVTDVLDCWFESGSMSFAQVHYPFENADWFEHHFPGDFIVEYSGQTRGWFYTMHVLAVALFDRPSFRSCISHGIVLGSDGQKMSKSLRNYPDVNEVFDRDGADAMRWFLMSSPILRGGNLVVTEQGIREGVRQAMLPLWNAWYFFGLYCNAFDAGAGQGTGYDARWSIDSTDVLDRYLLAKLHHLVIAVRSALDDYDIPGACEQVRAFLDVLTNWYIRRSRDRFWDTAGAGADRARAAFDTLFTTLEVLNRVAAPLLPMQTEAIWRGLTGGRSVHLTDWPDSDHLPHDAELVARMDRAREVCSVASSLRKADNLRVRLPLGELTVVGEGVEDLAGFTGIIADEVNVKQVILRDLAEVSEADFGIISRLTINARVAGPRLGRDVQQAIRGGKSGDWSLQPDGTVISGGLLLQEGEYTVETVVQGLAAAGAGARRAVGVLPTGGFLLLNTTVTEELAQEGIARDLVRAVQQARREAGLEVADRISLTVLGDQVVWAAALAFKDLIVTETLATQFAAAPSLDALPAGQGTCATVGDGIAVRLLVAKL